MAESVTHQLRIGKTAPRSGRRVAGTAAVAAVTRRHPDLTGPAFDRKVNRVLAIMAHSNDGPTWTGGTR